jgi:hypothetical protein
MTTIATDGKSMAGDGLRECESLVVATDTIKVLRLPDGRLFGAAGERGKIMQVRRWFIDGGDQPELKEGEFLGLVVELDGTVNSYDSHLEPMRRMLPTAVGTGEALALGAMLAGAEPQRAVEIACERDIYSGGTITVLKLGDGA